MFSKKQGPGQFRERKQKAQIGLRNDKGKQDKQKRKSTRLSTSQSASSSELHWDWCYSTRVRTSLSQYDKLEEVAAAL